MNVAAVWPMVRHAQGGFGAALVRNPLILAIAAGLAANLLGLAIPPWLEPTTSRIGASSITLGLLARAKVLAVSVLGIRHFVLPVVALGLAWMLGLSPVHTTVLLAFSALPTASSAYVLAAKMGYNGALTASLVSLSTLLGMASLPFALGVLR